MYRIYQILVKFYLPKNFPSTNPLLYSNQLEDTIRYIAETEFPDTWKNIFPNILTKLSNPNDYANLFAALIGLKSLVKNHQYLNGKDRIPLEYMVGDTFSILCDLVKSVLSTHNEQTERLLQVILKIFYTSIHVLDNIFFQKLTFNRIKYQNI